MRKSEQEVKAIVGRGISLVACETPEEYARRRPRCSEVSTGRRRRLTLESPDHPVSRNEHHVGRSPSLPVAKIDVPFDAGLVMTDDPFEDE